MLQEDTDEGDDKRLLFLAWGLINGSPFPPFSLCIPNVTVSTVDPNVHAPVTKSLGGSGAQRTEASETPLCNNTCFSKLLSMYLDTSS